MIMISCHFIPLENIIINKKLYLKKIKIWNFIGNIAKRGLSYHVSAVLCDIEDARKWSDKLIVLDSIWVASFAILCKALIL